MKIHALALYLLKNAVTTTIEIEELLDFLKAYSGNKSRSENMFSIFFFILLFYDLIVPVL